MAYNDINTVPQGNAGTGAAYLLGPNTALNQWMGSVHHAGQVRQQRRAEQRANNADFRKNQLNITPGKLFNKELQELVGAHVQQGAEAMAKGINPYNPNWNDPQQAEFAEQYQQSELRIKSLAAQVEEMSKQQKDAIQAFAKSESDYDPDDFQKILDFDKNHTLDEIASGEVDLPVLGKSFNMANDIVKPLGVMQTSEKRIERTANGDFTVDVVEADIPRIADAVRTSFMSGPGANKLIKDLRAAGFENARPDGLLGTTDEAEIRKALDNEFRSPTDNNPVTELMAEGKIPAVGSPEYKKFLDDSVRQQLKAEKVADNLINEGVRLAAAKVNPKYSEMPNFSYQNEARAQRSEARAARNEQRSERRLQLAESEASTKATGGQASQNMRTREIAFGVASQNKGVQPKTIADNYIEFDTAPVNIVGGGAVNMTTGKKKPDNSPSIEGELVGLGLFPFVSDPNSKLNGALAQKSFVDKGGKVQWKKMAQIKSRDTDGEKEDVLIPAENLPKTMTKKNMDIYNSFLNNSATPQSTKPAAQIKASSTTLDFFKPQ